jgi:hypothetical protein
VVGSAAYSRTCRGRESMLNSRSVPAWRARFRGPACSG